MPNTTTQIEERMTGLTSDGQRGVLRTIEFIQPGLAYYSPADLGISEGKQILIQKSTLDRMSQSIVGVPIFNEQHRKVSARDFSTGRAEGMMVGPVKFNDRGHYECPALIWDKATLKNIDENKFGPSCAYNPLAWSGQSGKHNNVPYDDELLDGEYTHLAIVPNPRYERLEILYNSTGGNMSLLAKLFSRSKDAEGKEITNSVEVDLEKAVVQVEGKEISASELVNSYRTEEARKASAGKKYGLDDSIEIDGKQVPIRELLNAHLAALKNSDEEKEKADKDKKDEDEKKNSMDMEKAHKDGDHKDSVKENCGMCNSKEHKNSVDEREKLKKVFVRIDNSIATGQKPVERKAFKSIEDRVAEGRERYGNLGTAPAAGK